MTGCFFRLITRKDRENWKCKLDRGDHNHGPLDFTAHNTRRKRCLSDEKDEKIKNATKCGTRPWQILNELKAGKPGCIIQLIDIYNKKRQLRAEHLKSPTPTHAVILALEEKKTWFHALDKFNATTNN